MFPFARAQRLLFMLAEINGAAVHAAALHDDPAGFSPALTALFAWGATVDACKHDAIRSELAAISHEARRALAGFDALLLPATPQAAFRFDDQVRREPSIFAALGSCLGWPATAFPTGHAPNGLPLAAELIAADGPACLAYAAELSTGQAARDA